MSKKKGRMAQHDTSEQLPRGPQKNPTPFKIYWVNRREGLFAVNWHKPSPRKSQYGRLNTLSAKQYQQYELNELTQYHRVITPFKRRLRGLLNHLLRIGQIIRKHDLDIRGGPLARKCFQFTRGETRAYETHHSRPENTVVTDTGQYTSEEITVAQILTNCLQIDENRGSSNKQVDTSNYTN